MRRPLSEWIWPRCEQLIRGAILCRTLADGSAALDYLRHKGSLSICVEPVKGLRIKADATYRFREGFYTDADGNILSYGGVLLFGAGAEYQWHKMTLFADGFNLSGRHYRDHGGVPMPGTTFIVGVRLDL